MAEKYYRQIRRVVSLLFLLFTGFIFLDFTLLLGAAVTNGITFLQFAPSLMKFVTLLSAASFGFIIILVLTLLFGRVYCSSVCPLGTLQDLVTFSRKKTKKKKFRFGYRKANDYLRYGLLLAVIVSILSGTILAVNLLDPYSNFGRIFSNLFRPVYIVANNLLVGVLERFEIYTLYRAEYEGIRPLAFSFSIAMLGLVGFMSWRRGREYCNTVCPVGTLLGLLSRVSAFRIDIEKALCTSCGKCSVVCKAECIDVKERKVDFSRCVACMNCLDSCPSSGIGYSYQWSAKKQTVDGHKRTFIATLGLFLLSSAGFAQYRPKPETLKVKDPVPVIREHPVSPPGSQSIGRYLRSCTACGLCVTSCPTNVLQHSFMEYGLAGLMLPKMDYITSYCNYDCLVCGEVCPTGAILPLSLEEKHLVQMGKAEFIKENCIVYTDNTACGACSEHCPTKAVDMVPYENGLTIPEVTADICVGCGACEYACPTDPKSIYIVSNVVHEQADPPKIEEVDEEVDYKEEFPF